MRRSRLVGFALALAGCGPGLARPVVDPAVPDPCIVGPASRAPADTVNVAADDALGPDFAIHARSRADRLLSALVFETLIRVTCTGEIVPGLAERWRSEDGGRDWTFTLRPTATFTDGSPVTSQDVVAAWRDRRSVGGRVDPRAAVVEGVAVASTGELTVRFRAADVDPRILADPVFAIHRTTGSEVIGSSTYVVSGPGDSFATANAAPVTLLAPRTPGSATVIRLYNKTSGDPRDLLDRGVEVLLTEDRRTVEYAATRNDLEVRSLPADRALMLLVATVDSGPIVDDSDPRWTPLRTALERDVLRQNGPAVTNEWWATPAALARCPNHSPTTTPRWTGSPAHSRRLVYAERDRAAGEIARRLVALATDARGTSDPVVALRAVSPQLARVGTEAIVATAVSDAELARSLMQGADFAYVIAWPRRALDPCTAWSAVLADAPWLRAGIAGRVVDSGPSLVLSGRAPAVVVEWGNTFRIAPTK